MPRLTVYLAKEGTDRSILCAGFGSIKKPICYDYCIHLNVDTSRRPDYSDEMEYHYLYFVVLYSDKCEDIVYVAFSFDDAKDYVRRNSLQAYRLLPFPYQKRSTGVFTDSVNGICIDNPYEVCYWNHVYVLIGQKNDGEVVH